MALRDYFHFSQANEIKEPEGNLDFFDVNLAFDSKLFLDPFLIKNSPSLEEKKLYSRFEKYFKEVLKRSVIVGAGNRDQNYLYDYLKFPEPKEVCLGYTERSTNGAGLGSDFAKSMTSFFLRGIAKKLVGDTEQYSDSDFNPNIFIVFAEGVAEDGISDLSINLMMDYLVKFTQNQCKKFGIKTKNLPVGQSFDYSEMDWTGGQYFKLPENPLKPGTPVVLIPKHWLRADTVTSGEIKSKAVGILRSDPKLREKFNKLTSRSLDNIDLEEIKEEILRDPELLKRFIKILEYDKKEPYNFRRDPLEFLAIKKFAHYFDKFKLPKSPTECNELKDVLETFLRIFREEFELRDGWRNCWTTNKSGELAEIVEPAWGRIFRGMGIAFFESYPKITFDPEVNTGGGILDFRVVFQDCRIAIELKKLSNSADKGNPPIPSYIHGIKRQLPKYSQLCKAQFAYYITGQHRFLFRKTGSTDHSSRAKEIRDLIPEIEAEMRKTYSQFKELIYINIDLGLKPSASKL